jgi:hypothetical protein
MLEPYPKDWDVVPIPTFENTQKRSKIQIFLGSRRIHSSIPSM